MHAITKMFQFQADFGNIAYWIVNQIIKQGITTLRSY